MKSALLCSAGILAACFAPGAESRFQEFTKKFAHAADRAEVVASSFLGGSGTEWLCAGGFQPDGTIVAAGVSLGPDLDLGVKATLLGSDGGIQAPSRQGPPRGIRPIFDKDGQRKIEPLSWNHPNATAFIVRLGSDLKTIKSVTRFGWKLGGLTSAEVDAQGNIYLCGPAANSVASISTDAQTLTSSNTEQPKAACAAIYLAKLTPEADKVQWVRVITGPSAAPTLTLDRAGHVRLLGPDRRVFDTSGAQLSMAAIPGGSEGLIAENPVDGTWARGGEHHWPTGREPYRDPTLNVYKPDGTLLYELYNWDGPLAGLNNLRLVSDSAIRGVIYDSDGTLLIHAWSDGGNSVMYREPYDVFTPAKNMGGLGFNISGAGVLSSAYLIKITTDSTLHPSNTPSLLPLYSVAAGTLWVGYLDDRNKPNSATINSMSVARDGSVCIGGSSAWGLIQTGNSFGGEPTGNYVAVLSKDLTSLRFCSTLPATAQVDLNNGRRCGFASGAVNGKIMAMFLSGAIDQEGERKPPLLHARQDTFGGGMSDGHLLLLDLSPTATR